MSRRKNKRIIQPKDRSDSELLKAAEQAEAACKLKEAFRHYKELAKRHPDKYSETLLRIQVARVEAFLQDGALESAKQMLRDLKGQISNEALKQLELRMAVTQSDGDTAAEIAWKAIDEQTQLAPKAYCLLLESLIFSNSAPPDDRLLENRDVQTILAVREGFIALCEDESEALSQALSKIPLNSVLAHWKLLLRAMEAWYSGNEELLEKCLQKLPDVEGKGAQIVQGLKLLHDRDGQVTADSLSAAFGIHGLYGFANDLIEIDKQVLKGNAPYAFKFAQKQFPDFLNQESVKDQIVTEGFVRLYEYATRDDSYRKFIDGLIANKGKPASSRLPFMQLNYRLGGKVLNCDCSLCLSRQGRDYLDVLDAKGIRRKESAHLKYHLAQRLVEQIKMDYEYIEDTDLGQCVELLEEARKEDPEMVRAGLLLAKCHLDSKNASKGNALLDELAGKFPEDPAVLLAAGRCCIERKTYVRGLKQLEQAYAINPHLTGLREMYVTGLLSYARQCYGKGLLDKGRDCFEKMKPHLQECSFDAEFTLGSRWMRLHQLELETSYGDDPSQLKSQVEKEWNGKETLLRMFTHLIAERLGNPKRVRKSTEKLMGIYKDNSLAKELEPKDVYALFAYFKHNHSKHAKDKYVQSEAICINLVRNYCESYVKERLEGILKLLWALTPDYLSPGGLLKLTKTWSKADRQNPQLKLMHIMALEAFGDPPEELLRNLDKAMKTARARGDEFALSKGSELRKKIEKARDAPHFDPIPDFGDPYDEYDYDEEDEYDYDDDDAGEKMVTMLEEIYQLWRTFDYKERKELEEEIKARMGKSAAKVLIKGIKERMKDEKQGIIPPPAKKTKGSASGQMSFPFDQ